MNLTKICTKCKLEKDFYFYRKARKTKLRSICKDCEKIYMKEYRQTEQAKINRLALYTNNKIRYSNYYKKYRNTDSYRKKELNKRKTNINFRLSTILRSRIANFMNRNQKSGSAVKDLGCSVSDLKIYLESKFQEGMTWDNYGKWHIDHIMPLSSFDLTDRDQFLKACHYTNLQPLWAEDNFKKSNRIIGDRT